MAENTAAAKTETKCRSPIIAVLGHVDHGKSSILDKIRNTAIIDTEAGGITQAIGASIVPLDTVKKICSALNLNISFSIPGLLFIDTPGHEAFTSLRKRGGNLADIAILVVDVNEGFKPQTIEAFEILRNYKTPFIIALNKVDTVDGFRFNESMHGKTMIDILGMQEFSVTQNMEAKLYNVVGYVLEHFKIESERYDRCDFTKQIAIVPCSAKLGIGIAELLMILTGLTQRYLEEGLKCNISHDSKSVGTILEVKTVEGMGMCIDAILYDGVMRVNDILIIGGLEKPIRTKVRGLFEPKALIDMRDKKAKYSTMREVTASTGVRISAPDIDNIVAGMPLISCTQNTPEEKILEYEKEIQSQIEEVVISTDSEGIVVKADTLGSLEALIKLLKDRNINIRKATVGNITRKDLADAESNFEKDPLMSVVLGFNITTDQEFNNDKVKILTSNIIYKLIDDYENWRTAESNKIEKKELEGLTRPAKIEYLRNYTFRASNPAIVGCEILFGELSSGSTIMNETGENLSVVKAIQMNKENVNTIKKKDQAAISLPGVTVGRQINEGDIFYSAISEDDFRKLKKLTKYLSKEETSLLKEIAEIMRKKNPVWGI